MFLDQYGNPVFSNRGRVFSLEDPVRIRTVWRSKDLKGHIDQPAVLFPRVRALSANGLDDDNHSTMDYELWGKFFLAGARFQYTNVRFEIFRQHPQQKTADGWRQTRSLLATAEKLIGMGN